VGRFDPHFAPFTLQPSHVHQRIVTGGGEAASKLPQFKAINTALSSLKTG
jgi:hypothetical protein